MFRDRVDGATAGTAWVVAGNYSRVRDLLWPRAQAIVWLDYSFSLVLGRLTARTVRRTVTREVLWSGNREYLWEHCQLWSEKSLFHWLLKTYGRTGASCPSSSPSRPTPTSTWSASARPARRRRGSPASRPGSLDEGGPPAQDARAEGPGPCTLGSFSRSGDAV